MDKCLRRVVLAGIVGLAACDANQTSEAGFIVSDSAGVRVIEGVAPSWLPGQEWRLSDEPSVTIGLVEGEPEYLFDRVTGAVTLADGAIAVADLGSSQIRIFGPDGGFRSRFGSRGEGPGEFRQILGLFSLPGDSLVVLDRLERLHVFDPDGAFRRTVVIGAVPIDLDPLTLHDFGQYGRVAGLFGDGTLVTWERGEVVLTESREFENTQTPDLTFELRRDDGSIERRLATVPGRVFSPHPDNLIFPVLFGANVYARTSEDELILGLSGSGEIRWIDRGGSLRQIAFRPWPRRTVTDAMIEAHVRGSVPPLSESVVRGRTPAEVLPPFSGLLVDVDGNVWIRHFAVAHADLSLQYIRTVPEASRWSVFGPDGAWLGEVEMPSSFTPVEIGSAYVLGLSRDEYGVDELGLYDRAALPVLREMNPFFLRGDFDGDGEMDVAFWVTERETGARGVAILHSTLDTLYVFGAGRPAPGPESTMPNQGRVDTWHLLAEGHVVRNPRRDIPDIGVGEGNPFTIERETFEFVFLGKSAFVFYWAEGRYWAFWTVD